MIIIKKCLLNLILYFNVERIKTISGNNFRRNYHTPLYPFDKSCKIKGTYSKKDHNKIRKFDESA